MVPIACIAVCPSTGWKLSGQLAWCHEGYLCKARVVRPRFCFMGWLLFMYTTTTFQSCDTIISVATSPHVAHSVAMIYHAMNAVKAVVTHLHSEQAPVIVADQPLYSLAKKLQWNFPATHGENKYVVFLGGMHVELTVDKCLGNWLEGSGWTTAVTYIGIASGGTADPFLKTSHLGRTKHVYQLTAAVLHILVNLAYVPYEGRALDDKVVDFTIWKKNSQMNLNLPTGAGVRIKCIQHSEGNSLREIRRLFTVYPTTHTLDISHRPYELCM